MREKRRATESEAETPITESDVLFKLLALNIIFDDSYGDILTCATFSIENSPEH